MACETLPADVQGCINIPLIRGDDKTVTMLFKDDSNNPIDLSGYDIRMEIRQGGSYSSVVSAKTPADGMIVSGNRLDIVFSEKDAVFRRDYGALSYDIAFMSVGLTQHWIKGQILFTKSITKTW